ncbi:unnamed protein product [Boreogadus saida]
MRHLCQYVCGSKEPHKGSLAHTFKCEAYLLGNNEEWRCGTKLQTSDGRAQGQLQSGVSGDERRSAIGLRTVPDKRVFCGEVVSNPGPLHLTLLLQRRLSDTTSRLSVFLLVHRGGCSWWLQGGGGGGSLDKPEWTDRTAVSQRSGRP